MLAATRENERVLSCDRRAFVLMLMIVRRHVRVTLATTPAPQMVLWKIGLSYGALAVASVVVLMLPICGTVSQGAEGKVVLELGLAASHRPERPQTTTRTPPPVTKVIFEKIRSGTITAHPTKQSVTVRNIQTQVSNIQRSIGLVSSSSGSWSKEADDMLQTWLLRPKQKHSATAALAIENAKPDEPAQTSTFSSVSLSSSSSSSSTPPHKKKVSLKRKMGQMQAYIGEL